MEAVWCKMTTYRDVERKLLACGGHIDRRRKRRLASRSRWRHQGAANSRRKRKKLLRPTNACVGRCRRRAQASAWQHPSTRGIVRNRPRGPLSTTNVSRNRVFDQFVTHEMRSSCDSAEYFDPTGSNGKSLRHNERGRPNQVAHTCPVERAVGSD